MTRTFVLERGGILFASFQWLLIFVLLTASTWNPFQILNIFGFLTLILLPGLLTTIIFRLERLSFWMQLSFAVAFSILELTTVALIGNMLLPGLGVAAPLAGEILLEEFSLLVSILTLILYIRAPSVKITLTFPFKARDIALMAVPVVLMVLVIVGALRLNNGEGNGYTILALMGMGAYIGALVFLLYKRKIHSSVVYPSLYVLSLSLLLMTSLRGWYTTGHDIQTEFFVFELTKNSGIWLIENYKNAYNACMSITILPTIFAALLKIPDPYIYKVLFQAIFAFVPLTVYAIARKYTSETIAFLSAIYFSAFPTFFGDMPMLNRQEIAFLFWALMIYILFETSVSVRVRRILFLILGIGVVLSHYSTTYTVIALLSFVIVFRPIARWVSRHFGHRALFRRSSIESLGVNNSGNETYITAWMVGVLILASFLWSSVLTDTSSNSIVRVIKETVSVMRQNTKEDARSSDVFYSLLSWGRPDVEKGLKGYEENIVQQARESAPATRYYDASLYEKYTIQAIQNSPMPLTWIGELLEQKGFDVAALNYLARQGVAKILQVLIIVGLAFILFENRLVQKPFEREFILLTLASLSMVACQVLLPVLSAEYGVLRAFQQSLMLLGIFIVFGSLALFAWCTKRVMFFAAGVCAVCFFLVMTGVFIRAFVKDPPVLHLANTGIYYDAYYTHESEIAAINWLRGHIASEGEQGPVIQSDKSEYSAMRSIPGAEVIHGIYPALLRRDSYVLLGLANVTRNESMVLWNSDVIVYSYPAAFLDETKDLLYSNGSSKIYR